MRDLFFKQKISLSNQIRALLLELGHSVAQMDVQLMKNIPDIFEDANNDLAPEFRFSLHIIWQCFLNTIEEIKLVEQKQKVLISKDKTCKLLQALEGVGAVCAILIKIALGNVTHFKNGREASACFGLTPVQHSSKEKIGSTSKMAGNKKLRSALYKGALAVVSQLEKRESRTQKEIWLKNLIARRGKK